MKPTRIIVAGLVLTILAFLLAIPITATLKTGARMQHYSMSSGSMEPEFPSETIIFVRKKFYGDQISKVKRGDVILFARKDEESGQTVDYPTRVIGLPGDAIETSGTTVKINGTELPHSLIKQTPPLTIYRETNGEASYQVQYGGGPESAAPFSGVVPAGQLFCLGDNRDNSYDSRYTGSVPFASVVGKQVAKFKKPKEKDKDES